MVVLSYKVASAPVSKCVACDCLIKGHDKSSRRKKNVRSGGKVPVSIREYFYNFRGISFSEHQKMCLKCQKEDISSLKIKTKVVKENVSQYVIDAMKYKEKFTEKKDHLDISYQNIDNKCCKLLCGRTKEDLVDILEVNNKHYKKKNKTNCKIKCNDLLICMTLVKHSLSQEMTGFLFGYERTTVSKKMSLVFGTLFQYYVKEFLGTFFCKVRFALSLPFAFFLHQAQQLGIEKKLKKVN